MTTKINSIAVAAPWDWALLACVPKMTGRS